MIAGGAADRLQLRVDGNCVVDVPLWYVFFSLTGRMPAHGMTVDARFEFAGTVHCVVIEFPTGEDSDE